MVHDLQIFFKLKIITVKQNGKAEEEVRPALNIPQIAKEYGISARKIRKTLYSFCWIIVRK